MVVKSAEIISDSEDESLNFVCPPGFKKINPKTTLSDLKDKQIWLIQMPHGFDMTSLKSFDLDDEYKEGSLKVGKSKFSIKQDDDSTGALDQKIRLLTRSSDKDKLSISSKKICKAFKINETVTIPEINIKEVAVPKPKVQPIEGLVMKWQPTGYGPSNYVEAKSFIDGEDEVLLKESPEKKRRKKEHKHNEEKEKKKKKDKSGTKSA